MNRAERLARLLNILAAIIAEPGLNPLELADRAGVSERTRRPDLKQLRELGYDVAYTSGYEVQEKLNLEGRPARAPKRAYEQQLELLQAVAQAVGLGGDGEARTGPRLRPAKGGRAPGARKKSAPIVLIPTAEMDANFIYATGFPVETGLYIRFAKDDEVLVASPLEVDRARVQSRVKNVLVDQDAYVSKSWAALAARMLRERGIDAARVAPPLHARQPENLRARGSAG